MFGMNKKEKKDLHQGGKIGTNPIPTSNPPSAPGESNIAWNEYGLPILKPGTIPMPEVKPPKEECLYCNKDDILRNNEYDFQGDDGIIFDKKDEKHYLVLEHFRGEINKVQINNCPQCGRRL